MDMEALTAHELSSRLKMDCIINSDLTCHQDYHLKAEVTEPLEIK